MCIRDSPAGAPSYPESSSERLVFKTALLDYDSPSLIVTDPTSFAPVTQGTRPELRGWTDLDEEATRRHVLAGGSIFVSGLPGTAKSTTVRGWVEELDKRVFLCGPTHVSSRNLTVGENQGMTLQRFWNRYLKHCLLYTSPSPRDATLSRMPSSA